AARIEISAACNACPSRRMDHHPGRKRRAAARRPCRRVCVTMRPTVMTTDRYPLHQNADLLATVRSAARQDQFLEVILPEEARRRFESAIDRSPLAAETVRITQALGRVLASDLAAETDVPAFDRASVDGFAVRAADTIGAGDRAPRRLLLNAEVIASGHSPTFEVRAGTASAIATGGGASPRRALLA